MLDNNHKSFENQIITLETELQGMKSRIQETEHSKQTLFKEMTL